MRFLSTNLLAILGVCGNSAHQIQSSFSDTQQRFVPGSEDAICSVSSPLRLFGHLESCSTQTKRVNATQKIQVNTSRDTKIWSHPPRCTPSTTNDLEQFCSYTSQSFHNGRGITIITRPEAISFFERLPVLVSPTLPMEKSTTPVPFTIKYIQGKGMGVVANRTIQRGELLFAHAAIGIVNDNAFPKRETPSSSNILNMFHGAIEGLPSDTRKMFWALAAHEESETKFGKAVLDGHGVIARLNTNTFGDQFGGEDYSFVIPETAVSIRFLLWSHFTANELPIAD